MAKYVEDNTVLDPIFHVELDFAIARGCRATWEAVRMQNSFASYFAWCKMGKFRRPFQPMMRLNIARIYIKEEVPMLVWSTTFG